MLPEIAEKTGNSYLPRFLGEYEALVLHLL